MPLCIVNVHFLQSLEETATISELRCTMWTIVCDPRREHSPWDPLKIHSCNMASPSQLPFGDVDIHRGQTNTVKKLDSAYPVLSCVPPIDSAHASGTTSMEESQLMINLLCEAP